MTDARIRPDDPLIDLAPAGDEPRNLANAPFVLVSKDEYAELRTECNALRAATQAFLAKHDALEPAITNAFMLAQIHGCPYKGDNWSAELETLRSLAVEGERG